MSKQKNELTLRQKLLNSPFEKDGNVGLGFQFTLDGLKKFYKRFGSIEPLKSKDAKKDLEDIDYVYYAVITDNIYHFILNAAKANSIQKGKIFEIVDALLEITQEELNINIPEKHKFDLYKMLVAINTQISLTLLGALVDLKVQYQKLLAEIALKTNQKADKTHLNSLKKQRDAIKVKLDEAESE